MSFFIQRVLISDEIDDVCLDILRQDGIAVIKNTKLTHAQLVEEIKEFDALIVRSATRVDAAILSSGSRLKVVGRAGVGVDNIDCDTATARGILVLNTPAGNTISAAEHTCAMLCSIARHIPSASASMKAGKWDRKSYMGNELLGKTLAIIGLGRIGREVAQRMQAFGMKTIGYDPIVPAEVSASFGVESFPLESIWPLADFFTIHTPLIPQTKDLFSKSTFPKCKKGFRIINCARGGIINEEDLLEALQTGQCGGAALDVFSEEPPTSEAAKALIQHEKVISTPHLGASTVEAQIKVAEEVAQALVSLSNGRGLYGAVNGQALSQAISASSQSWVKLCTSLGNLMHQLSPQEKEFQVTLSLSGFDKVPSFVEAAIAMGLLSSQQGEEVSLNLINSPLLAKQHGLIIHTQMNPLSCGTNNVTLSTNSTNLNLTAVLCGDEAALIEFCGDALSQPLKFSSSGHSHLSVFDQSNSASVWSFLPTHHEKVVTISKSNSKVFLLTSEHVEIDNAVLSCLL